MKEIIAKDGIWLTQTTLEEESSRIFVRKVYTNDVSLWRDATDEEKEQWEREHPAEEPTDVSEE